MRAVLVYDGVFISNFSSFEDLDLVKKTIYPVGYNGTIKLVMNVVVTNFCIRCKHSMDSRTPRKLGHNFKTREEMTAMFT